MFHVRGSDCLIELDLRGGVQCPEFIHCDSGPLVSRLRSCWNTIPNHMAINIGTRSLHKQSVRSILTHASPPPLSLSHRTVIDCHTSGIYRVSGRLTIVVVVAVASMNEFDDSGGNLY